MMRPHPSKLLFFWPSEDTGELSIKRPRIKVPSVATSDEWLAFYKKKKFIKENEERAKADRKEKNMLKRQTAVQNKIKLKRNKNKVTKKKSEKTDLEPTMIDIPAIKPGNYVIFSYEEEYFPGVVIAVDKNKALISSMSFSGQFKFKWPEKEDRLWYKIDKIVEIIAEPIQDNNRGMYKVPEMAKFQKSFQ